MTADTLTNTAFAANEQDSRTSIHQAGEECARSHLVSNSRRHRIRHDIKWQDCCPTLPSDQSRLVRTAAKETRSLDRSLRKYPCVVDSGGNVLPRACAVADGYLNAAAGRFAEHTLLEFITGYQQIHELRMGEIWAIKPALQFALLQRIAAKPADKTEAIASLRDIGQAVWKELFESLSAPDRILAMDPDGAYSAMDYESRDLYRNTISRFAKHSELSESAIAAVAVKLAKEARHEQNQSRFAARRAHVGFYLIDRGVPRLLEEIKYRPPKRERIRAAILDNPTAFYLIGVELLSLALVAFLLGRLDTITPIVAGFFLLLLPATQAAVDFMNSMSTWIAGPRVLPKLDFSEGIPADCGTLVAVPSLLLNEKQVRNLVLDLEIRFLANRDPHLHFALVTDSPDSLYPEDEREALVQSCCELIDGLNAKYSTEGHVPFLFLHRHRIYNASEGRWMGWERKRGKLLDLNQLLRGAYDSFPIKSGDTSVFPNIRYIITLDSDTQLPRDAAAKLVGAIAHPLNKAVVDPVTKMVVEGYGILQPRIGISIDSASRSRLAALYSGQTGFDIYTRAVSDAYQDIFAEGIFTGKGIYELDVFREVLEQRFPENALLSHDLIEGAYARAALVSDIELIDDYPSHFSAYSRRKHRWVRGDWQIMRWLLTKVPDFHGDIIANPINVISRWKILDNLRRSLIEPAILILLLAGWFYLPGHPWFWTGATLFMLFVPVYANFLFAVVRPPIGSPAFKGWAREVIGNFVKGNIVTGLALVFLLHQAMLSLDAIGRSVLRVFVTKRRLLEWETAAEAESAKRRRAPVDIYLDWSPVIAAVLGIAVWRFRPDAAGAALPVIFLWFVARGLSAWLNRPPRTRDTRLKAKDAEFLRESAARTWRFFKDWSSPASHWLIPDNVCEDGRVALRLSPTNVGFLLNARIAAVHLKLIGIPEFIRDTKNTLDSLERLTKFRGHLLNWYDAETLTPLEPLFVSSVDSGNLAACLWTLKQAAIELAEQGSTADDLRTDLLSIAATSHRLVHEMDFRFLYQRRKKVLSVGYDVAAARLEPASYDLLASESRIASFVAIAKGDIPQEAWFHLGRGHILYAGRRVLLSWTGTMFEYLMPSLWMNQYTGTITEVSVNAAVEAQQKFARRFDIPWGISESGCSSRTATGDYDYAPFGLKALALKHVETHRLVVSPYSSFLALHVDPVGAIRNLRRMEELGWSGKYGFYEAVDYGGDNPGIVRSWMAHHQGMSLLAACNALCGDALRRHFHSEPQVMATDLLLHERVPTTVVPERQADTPRVEAVAPAPA
jgi:cyclic beta-1,2-glucan synthetase